MCLLAFTFLHCCFSSTITGIIYVDFLMPSPWQIQFSPPYFPILFSVHVVNVKEACLKRKSCATWLAGWQRKMLNVFTMSELPSLVFAPFEACPFSIPQASPAPPLSGLLDTTLRLELYCIPLCYKTKDWMWRKRMPVFSFYKTQSRNIKKARQPVCLLFNQ